MRTRLAILAAALVAGVAAAPASAALSPLRAVPDRHGHGHGRIVDRAGREVILRGVNVNALAEYWKGTRFRTTFPLEARDPARMRALGFDAVRLVLSWSRIEPAPGRYDRRYLDRVQRTAARLTDAGLYVILDLHQDAWGASLAARPGEACPAGSDPALGWDGAPAWATLVPASVARCAPGGVREVSPAVRRAWTAFWADASGPGGVGIQTRYVRMLGHVARAMAGQPGIAGYDLMNEPNAFGGDEQAALSRMYARGVRAIRAGERRGHGGRRMILFEPSAVWSETGRGAPPRFRAGRDAVYAPHIYSDPLGPEAFRIALQEARGLGGVPVLTGEWGAARGQTEYMTRHLDLQDRFGISSTQWTWRESCGDPHQRGTAMDGTVSTSTFALWGIDCATNRILPIGHALRATVRRGYVRAAPGRLVAMRWTPAAGTLRARGAAARPGTRLEAFVPRPHPVARGRGLCHLRVERAPGGARVTARAAGGAWRLRVGR